MLKVFVRYVFARNSRHLCGRVHCATFFALVLCFVSVFALDSFAQESAASSLSKAKSESQDPQHKRVSVEWYRPEAQMADDPNRVRVIFSGVTEPGYQIRIQPSQLPIVTKEKTIQSIPTKTVLVTGSKVLADKGGYFELALDLPVANIQVPLQVRSKAGASRIYQFNLVVQKQEVKAINFASLKRSPLLAKKYQLWFGLGFNYVRYYQSTGIPSEVEFESTNGPSAFAKASMEFNPRWEGLLSVKWSPGSTSTGEVEVNQGSYYWSILGAEGIYRPTAGSVNLLGKYRSQWGLRFGLQHHIMPFISRTGGAQSGVVDVLTNSMTMATLGFIGEVKQSRRLTYEIFMRYQVPLATGSLFSAQSELAFDGSVGARYRLNRDWNIGVFWYGQWHKYDFSGHRDKILNEEIGGHQDLFFSNIDVRIGYEF